tara:strand:- start:189 stop:449 length:261 start_codon:yes stop_codon:yes gene_type:complete
MKDSKPLVPSKVIDLAVALHKELIINENSWHKLKGDHDRRAAELISASLVKLLSGNNSSDIEAHLEQSMLWLKREINAPSCPDRKN